MSKTRKTKPVYSLPVLLEYFYCKTAHSLRVDLVTWKWRDIRSFGIFEELPLKTESYLTWKNNFKIFFMIWVVPEEHFVQYLVGFV